MYPPNPTSGKLPRTESRMRSLASFQLGRVRLAFSMRPVVGNGRNRPASRIRPIRYLARVIFGLRSPRGALLLASVVLGGLPTASGCAYLFVTAPQGEGRNAVAGDCTSNVAAPVIDTLLTTTNAFSTLYVAGQSNVKNQGQAIGDGLLATGFWMS